MRTLERRIVTMEHEVRNANDADALSDQELAALIVDQLEEWCRAGLTVEQIADGLMGLGYDEEARTIPSEFKWDPVNQVIRDIRLHPRPSPSKIEGLRR